MAMTKTDYEIVGKEIGHITNKENRLRVASRLSAAFTVRDHKFDRSRFMQCASVWSCEFCEYLADSKIDYAHHYRNEHFEEQENR